MVMREPGDTVQVHAIDAEASEALANEASEAAYAKPALVRLGRWNVFTRSPSEEPTSGFFEFDF